VSDDLSSLSSSFLSPASDAAAPGDPHRSRARAGWDARPFRLARTPRGRCAHARESNLAPGRDFPFCPHIARTCVLAGAEGAGAASAARPVQARADWGFRPDVRGTGLQRQERAATRTPKPPTPIGVFPFFTSERAVRGREKACRRCVEPREGAAAPGRRRRAKDGDYNRRHEERRPSALGEEAGSEQGRLRRRERPRRREHLRHATVHPRAGHNYTIAPM
jgi:hypothetical protein